MTGLWWLLVSVIVSLLGWHATTRKMDEKRQLMLLSGRWLQRDSTQLLPQLHRCVSSFWLALFCVIGILLLFNFFSLFFVCFSCIFLLFGSFVCVTGVFLLIVPFICLLASSSDWLFYLCHWHLSYFLWLFSFICVPGILLLINSFICVTGIFLFVWLFHQCFWHLHSFWLFYLLCWHLFSV